MKKKSIVVAGLVLALVQGCRPSAAQRADAAIAEVRSAVIAYGRKGSVAEKQKAFEVVRSREKAEREAKAKKAQDQKDGKKKKKRSASLHFGVALLAHKLGQVRKGSPDPNLASGPLTAAERTILEAVNEPIAEADVQMVEASVRETIGSQDVRTRLSAADRLFSAGEAGLPALERMMRDQNSEVATTAAVHVVEIIRMIDDDRETVACAKAGMLTAHDAATLEKLGLALVMCTENRLAVQAAVAVIEHGAPEQSAAAKEAYSSITGDEWTNKAAADAWIKENCEQEDGEDVAISAEAIKAQNAQIKNKAGKGTKGKPKK